MAILTPPSLGILDLQSELTCFPEPLSGSLRDPASFNSPIMFETVTGGWADTVIRGDPALENACIAAAKSLVERGAVVITADCGYFIRHQAAVAASVKVPVVLSSLVLAPALLRQIPSAAKLGVVCADSTSFTEDLLGVDNPTDRARVAVGGIEGSKLLQDLCAFTVPQNDSKAPLPTLNVADIETEVAACVTRLRAAHPEIAALLFECTAFPIASAAIRRATKVPVYDITDVCRMALASVS